MLTGFTLTVTNTLQLFHYFQISTLIEIPTLSKNYRVKDGYLVSLEERSITTTTYSNNDSKRNADCNWR